jgi:hypothetical protein
MAKRYFQAYKSKEIDKDNKHVSLLIAIQNLFTYEVETATTIPN